MNAMIGSIFAIVFLIIVLNIVMLFLRVRKDHPFKFSKKALNEDAAAKLRERRVYNRLEREQYEAERFIERRNKTWALYDQVRGQEQPAERRSASSGSIVNSESGIRNTGLEIPYDD